MKQRVKMTNLISKLRGKFLKSCHKNINCQNELQSARPGVTFRERKALKKCKELASDCIY